VLAIARAPGSLTIVSRFARPRALAVLSGALAGAALLAAGPLPRAAAALGAAALLVLLLGGRAVRAAFAGGRVRITAPVPLARPVDCALSDFTGVRVETRGEARRRRAERHARALRDRSGGELPGWLRPPHAPGTDDHLRRLVLEQGSGEPVAVTAWLADDDLEPAREAAAALLGAWGPAGVRPAVR
jgi:hypothetical protein